MSEQEGLQVFPLWRSLMPPMIAGALASLLVQILDIPVIDIAELAARGPSRAFATAIGMFSLSASIGIILIAFLPPKRFYPPEDAEELLRLRGTIASTGCALFAFGAGLSLLASEPGELLALSGWKPLAIAGLAAIGLIMTLRTHRLTDEFGKQIAREAATFGFGTIALVAMAWGIAAHLGYVAGPAPLDLVSLTLATHLLSKMLAMVRRGQVKWR